MLNIVAITGAGLSVASGIRPYRGENGVYTELEARYGMSVETLLTPQMFKRDPDLFWQYWTDMAVTVGSVLPNDAHRSLVELSDKSNFLEITQNVDGLSKSAGLLSTELIELHGTAYSYRCFRCGIAHNVTVHAGMITPRCTQCGQSDKAPIRPNIVMFGENIKAEHYKRAFLAAKNADVLLLIGTTLQFGYLGDFVQAAATTEAVTVMIDPSPEAAGYCDITLRMDAVAGLALIAASVDVGMETKVEFLEQLRKLAST